MPHLVIPALNDKSISLASNNVDLRNQKAIYVPEDFSDTLPNIPSFPFLATSKILPPHCYTSNPPGYSPPNVVGDRRITIFPSGWTDLREEHSVLWFVALDSWDEPWK